MTRKIAGRLVLCVLFLSWLLISCSSSEEKSETEQRFAAYCTCGHREPSWWGEPRRDRQAAERDAETHNRQPNHCATVEPWPRGKRDD